MVTQIMSRSADLPTVISRLDVDTLPNGTHQFLFRVMSNALGQDQLLPVWVFKGSSQGKKVMITAGVHGDELNGVLTAQQLARELQTQDIYGTITIVPAINLSGLLHHHRDFYSSDSDLSTINLNRHFPGNFEGNAAEQYIAKLWHNLLLPNADIAIDLHTQTSGACYPLYVFADFRMEVALNMARLMSPDVILNDPGDNGVLETTWNQHAIPSITVEVGSGKLTQPDLIERSVYGIQRILQHHECIAYVALFSNPTNSTIEGDSITSIRAKTGGLTCCCVSMLDTVRQDDLLAIQYDLFGVEVYRYFAPCDGVVLSHNTDALRETGSLIVRLLH